MPTLRHGLKRLNPLRLWQLVRRAALALANWRKRRVKHLDYLVLTLPGTMPALPERRPWLMQRVLGQPPLSLYELGQAFERIAADPRLKGVVLRLRVGGLAMSLADLQTLRGLILRLRAAGKRVACFAMNYETRGYTVASAADDVLLGAGGEFYPVGVRIGITYLRETLDLLGVQASLVQITPYKSAMERFTRRFPSPENEEQIEWLLDSRYEQIVAGIAAGRGLTPEAVRAMFDGAPHLASEALAAGYVDAVLSEEELPAYLGAEHLVPWARGIKALPQAWQPRADRAIKILPMTGNQVEGESQQPPVELPIPFIGGERMGSFTVVQQVRNLMRDTRAAAVVLFIDSDGGSSSAVEEMIGALRELAADRPVVAYFNGAAASGGYYVAMPAAHIVAQSGTITGSIGVYTAKLSASGGGLAGRLGFNTVEFLRGANANLTSLSTPWSEEQLRRERRVVEDVYRRFVAAVAQSRGMAAEAVDAVGGGRVWTGTQALAHGLVDELGGLEAAVAKARELAGLPADAPVEIVTGKGKPLGPQLTEVNNPAAALRYLQEGLAQLSQGVQVRMQIRWE
ncbi:MAG: S49 family peptidase [Anaerolineae bacterium]|nr:S49 family peptidase [Anaerolineae bacterium]